MKVLLISANTERMNILPLPLGLNCVAVATRNAGHLVLLLDLMAEKDSKLAIMEAITSFCPDVIGISVRNIDSQNMDSPILLLDQVKDVIDDCRTLSIAPIILGGAGYSIYPESALEYLEADMGIQGEGEVAFPVLLDKIQRGADLSGTPGLYLRGLGPQGKRLYAEGLDELPLPDEKLWFVSSSGRDDFGIPIQTRRGCPMDCNYCSTATIEGRALRKRSPGLVIKNIKRHVNAGYKMFYFVDNTFNIPLPYAKELCRMIINEKLGISWNCIIYPGKVDKEFVDLLVMAGCKEVSLGFESGSENILRVMNKKFTLSSIRHTSEMLKACGIKQLGFLMLGGPGETKESARQSLVFADSLKLDAMKVSIGIRIYPHTLLSKTAIACGLISPEDDLLSPRFYIVSELEQWLRKTVTTWMENRPNWMT
ncbi:MAG: 2-hydroxyethylphosphonate methyltransferase [Syntrophus sp. SKADARSKE-3]|nr:2-hydroxyethylphosphonate methyltransferase [Syntrophus sp. SKADARSKE-3]